MASSHLDKEFIAERQAKYAEAYNTADVDKILSFMSEDIEFCDYSTFTFPFQSIPTDTPLRRRDAQP